MDRIIVITDEQSADGIMRAMLPKSYVINVSYAETGAPMITDVLQQVRFHSPDLTNSEGTEALTVKCELDILKPILWSGTSALSGNMLFIVAP
jgi:hypothetical protein